MDDSNKKDLRIQYQQCFENYRMWDRHVWQMPSVAIVIATAVVGVAFGYLKNTLIPSCIVLSFGLLLIFSMFLGARKHRFFQHFTIERIRRIETELSLAPLPLVTGQGGVEPRDWTERRSAGEWLAHSVLFTFLCMFALLIFNIIRGLYNPCLWVLL